MKSFKQIEDILSNSDKAELIEKLSNVLDVEGCKVVVITGVPNKETGNLDVEVWQTGHAYSYEEWGFIHLGLNTLENYDGDIEETALEICIEALRAAEMRQGCTNHSYYAEILLKQIHAQLIPQGDDEGLAKPSIDELEECAKVGSNYVCHDIESAREGYKRGTKAQRDLTRQEIPEAVKAERERIIALIKTIFQALVFKNERPTKGVEVYQEILKSLKGE